MTVPEPALSVRILNCSGSTCRLATETDQRCGREKDRQHYFFLVLIFIQLWRFMFTYWLTQTSQAAASASGSPTCSCLPSAAGINGKVAMKLHLVHMTFAQEQVSHFPPSLSQPLTCIRCNQQRHANKEILHEKSLSGKESFLFKATK